MLIVSAKVFKNPILQININRSRGAKLDDGEEICLPLQILW
jgi:hypothetical protein